MKKISIIIPVYNTQDYLVTCINSLINQTYSNMEFIFIDDGSTDHSLAILKEYEKQDSRIKVFCQKNKGVSVARNKGIELATGDYIGFVDSDDIILKNMYERLLDVITRSKSDMAVCQYAVVREQLDFKLGLEERIYIKEEAIKLLLEEKTISNFLWDKLYKKELFDEIRFRDSKIFEDFDTIYKLIDKSKRVCVIDDVMYAYFQRSDSYVHKFSYSYISNYVDVYNNRREFLLNKYPKLEKDINKSTVLSIFILFRMIVLAERKDLLDDDIINNEYNKLLSLSKVARTSLTGIKKILINILIFNKKLFYVVASLLYKIRGINYEWFKNKK